MSLFPSLADHAVESQPAGLARILLVDDHPLIRQAIRGVIEHESGLVVCAEAGDADAALEFLGIAHPHLVLLDLSLGQTNGLDLIAPILHADPSIRILILSMHDYDLYAEKAFRAGAHGYVNKRAHPDTIVAAIRTVLAGGIFRTRSLVTAALGELPSDMRT